MSVHVIVSTRACVCAGAYEIKSVHVRVSLHGEIGRHGCGERGRGDARQVAVSPIFPGDPVNISSLSSAFE